MFMPSDESTFRLYPLSPLKKAQVCQWTRYCKREKIQKNKNKLFNLFYMQSIFILYVDLCNLYVYSILLHNLISKFVDRALRLNATNLI